MKQFYLNRTGIFNFLRFTKFIFAVIFILGLTPVLIKAQSITVSTTVDAVDGNTANIASLIGTPGGAGISLREAIIATNNEPAGATITINIPAGSYSLTIGGAGENAAATGDLDLNTTVAAGNKTVSILGAGSATTTITQTIADRIFDVHPVNNTGSITFNASNVKLTGGNITGSGGAMLTGRPGDVTNLTDCIFINNTASTNGGAISQSSSLASHNLTITNCTFTNNTATGATGGAVNYNGIGNIIISGCTFTGNTAGTQGGAINITGGGTGANSGNITECTFSGNTANGATFGGAALAMVNVVTVNINFNRIVGNLSPNVVNGKMISTGGGTVGTMNTNNNWWGTNSGPAAGDILGTAAANWLQLKNTATPATICVSSTSTITASFLANSAGNAIAAGNLGALVGLPIAFNNAVNGTLSSAQSSIQSSGTATVTFTGTTAGNGSANAVFVPLAENFTVTTSPTITVNGLSTAPTGATGTTTICNGGNTVLTVTGGSKGTGATTEWFTGSCGGTSAGTGDAITVSPTATTTYYVRYSGTCNNTTCATVTVTVNSLSTAPTGATGTTTICNGGNTVLTVTGGSKGTGATTEWFTGSCGGTSAGTGDAITVSPTTTTTYYVRYSGTCNNTTCATVTVTVNSLSTAPTGATGTTTICNGGNTVLTVTGGSKGAGATTEWFTGSCGGTSAGTGDAITVSPTATTTYYVRYSGTCNNTTCATVTVTVNSLSTAPTGATGTTTICNGGNTVLTVTGGSKGTGATTEWFTGSCGGTSAGTGDAITVSPTTTTTYYVRYTGTCNTTTCATVTVTVNSLSTVPTGATGITTICNGGNTVLTVTGGSKGTGATTQWFTGSCGGTSAGTGDAITVSPATTTNYYVRYSGTCNTTTCATVTVTVNASSITAPTVTQPTCATPTGTIVVNATGSGTLEYQLNSGAFQTSNTFGSLAPGSYDITVRLQSSPTCLSTYSGNPVVLSAATGCCVPPVITAPTVTQPTCATPTGTIVVNATGGGTLEYQLNSGAFQTSNTFGSLAPGSYDITVRLQSSPTCLSTYSGNPVVLSAATGCCVPPVITAPTVTQPTCATPTGTIVVKATGGGTLEYQLNSGAFQTSNTFASLAPGSYDITVRLQSSPSCLSTYSGNPVVLSAATGCCVPPVITGPTVTQPTCATPTGTIVVKATGGGTLEYQLNSGAFQTSNTFASLAPGSYDIAVRLQSSPTCLSTYSGNPVVLSAATGCCVPPVITAPTVTQPTCATPTGTIVVKATGGTLEYQLNSGAFQTSNTFSGLAPGSYDITVRLQSSPTCLSTYIGNPVVLSAATGCCVPSTAPTGATGTTTICKGGNTVLTVAGGSKGTGATIQWFTGSCGGTSAGTGDAVTVSPTTTTTYYVRYSGTCNTTTCATVMVTVNSLSTAPTGATGTTTICIGSKTVLTVAGGSKGTGATTQWFTGSCGGTSAGTGVAITVSPTTTTTYYVRFSGTCNTTTCATVTVTVQAPVVALANTSNSGFNVSLSNTMIKDNNCHLIATLLPSGAAPVNGIVAAKVTIDPSVNTAANGRPYVQRHYDIEPATNAANATATLTLYFTQAEFNAFNAFPSNGPDIPAGPADAAGIANLRIFQFHGVGTGNPNTPATYPGPAVEIDPDDNKVVFNSTLNSWEVTINVTGFSGFFSGNLGDNILPVQLVSFTGDLQQQKAMLQWTTSREINTQYFELQRSTNGSNFIKLTSINAEGNNLAGRNYHYADDIATVSKQTPLLWYRLKLVDRDGRFTYSNVIMVNIKNKANIITVSPNPFSRQLMVNIESAQQATTAIRFYDMSGKILQEQTVILKAGNNSIRINQFNALASGSYIMQVQNAQLTETIRLLKTD